MGLLGVEFGKWIESGIIQSIQYDTYVREVERYAGKSVELCEAIFHEHSAFVLKIGPMLFRPETSQRRWMFAANGVDRLLDTFSLSKQDKLDMVSTWCTSMLTEYTESDELKRKLDI